MKATKAILAIMAVAVMVIVPLSAANVDAEKEITDAYSGVTVRNDRDLSYSDYQAVEEDYKLSKYSKSNVYALAFEYCNVLPENMTVTSMNLTTYDYNVFSEQDGKEYTIQYGYTLKGSITFTYNVEKDGNYPLATSNTSETDLLNVANKELGTATTSDVITVSGDFEVVYVYKQYTNYKEAKDTYVVETVEWNEYCKGISNAKVTLKDKSVSINMDCAYKYEAKDKEDLSSITKDTETSAIPYIVQCSRTADYKVYDASLKGTVADKDYSSDLDKKLNDSLKSRAETQTRTFDDNTITNSDLICAALTVGSVYYYYYGSIDEYLKTNGCTGETNPSGARDGISSQVNSVTGSSSGGFPIWAIIVIIVAVIVIALIVVLLVKKKKA